jgi:hypothetical protein
MKVLALLPEYAMLTASGFKDEEIRTVPTRIPKSPENRLFGIYASHSKPSKTNIEYCRQMLEDQGKLTVEIDRSLNMAIQGHILGIGSMITCTMYDYLPTFIKRQNHHLNRSDQFLSPCYGWQIVNVHQFQNPIPHKFATGTVIWGKIDDHQIKQHIEESEPDFNWGKPDWYVNKDYLLTKYTYQQTLF